jgi:hypothetical protein
MVELFRLLRPLNTRAADFVAAKAARGAGDSAA